MSAEAETLAKALDWIHTQLHLHPQRDKLKVVEEAATKFDLGPLDEEWLLNQLKHAKH